MKKESKRFAILTLVGSLQDFVPGCKQSLKLNFELQPSVKDMVEAKGIPHTAVFKLEINGKEESFDYNLQHGDRVKVYPFESVDEKKFDSIFSCPTAFIADVHLGKLAKTLRLLGFDTAFDKNGDDTAIVRQSSLQRRMILTRDIELLKNGKTRYGYWVRSTNPDQQIRELFTRFSLADKMKPFSRCMNCNGILSKKELDKVKDRIPLKVKRWNNDFWECGGCGKVYWRGSHF